MVLSHCTFSAITLAPRNHDELAQAVAEVNAADAGSRYQNCHAESISSSTESAAQNRSFDLGVTVNAI